MKRVRNVFTRLSLAVLLVIGQIAAAAADLPHTREDGWVPDSGTGQPQAAGHVSAGAR
jgi:hypothetical protein